MALRLASMDKQPTDPGIRISPEQLAVLQEKARKRRQKQIDAARAKTAMRNATGTMPTKPSSSEGTGGSDDPAWGRVAGLLKNGLPG